MREPVNVVLLCCDTCHVVRGYDVAGFQRPEYGWDQCSAVSFDGNSITRCGGYLEPVNVVAHRGGRAGEGA